MKEPHLGFGFLRGGGFDVVPPLVINIRPQIVGNVLKLLFIHAAALGKDLVLDVNPRGAATPESFVNSPSQVYSFDSQEAYTNTLGIPGQFVLISTSLVHIP